MEEFYSFVGKRLSEGKRVVVATVIEAEGSAPPGRRGRDGDNRGRSDLRYGGRRLR